MSRSTKMISGVAVAVLAVVAVVSQLGAPTRYAPAATAPTPPLPRGVIVLVTASAPDVEIRLRDVDARTVGGRPFLVGAPAEARQLTATRPQVWIPVDTILQITESGTTP